MRAINLARNPVLHLDKLRKPLDLHFMRNLIVHLRSLGAGPDGISEHVSGIETSFLHETHRVLELLVRLSGETQHNVRGDSDSRHSCPKFLHDFPISCDRVSSMHSFKKLIVSDLEREVDMLADLWER